MHWLGRDEGVITLNSWRMSDQPFTSLFPFPSHPTRSWQVGLTLGLNRAGQDVRAILSDGRGSRTGLRPPPTVFRPGPTLFQAQPPLTQTAFAFQDSPLKKPRMPLFLGRPFESKGPTFEEDCPGAVPWKGFSEPLAGLM